MSTKAVLRRILMTNPHAFRLLWRRKENSLFERRVVRKGDDIEIEGLPRSGNTFASAAFRLAERPSEI